MQAGLCFNVGGYRAGVHYSIPDLLVEQSYSLPASVWDHSHVISTGDVHHSIVNVKINRCIMLVEPSSVRGWEEVHATGKRDRKWWIYTIANTNLSQVSLLLTRWPLVATYQPLAQSVGSRAIHTPCETDPCVTGTSNCVLDKLCSPEFCRGWDESMHYPGAISSPSILHVYTNKQRVRDLSFLQPRVSLYELKLATAKSQFVWT